ncbi:tryptophan 7-halogenase [Hoyosella sp. YIM 151337]|uniref:FAD-dependent oxidoreductase n=1 Tax=Hoyosella sp. YIM 151337 TaxID=2992742 RepID=UPI0022369BB1|nr:FAD-dependent monooxygenase [Hoyosella sp. YIM 151337]MCW4352560.1 tryptophan 7-halogenase [Hoyosella sp. YIM 151337]
MRTLIVGSGPTGLMLGAALARRGHQVVSVDRDPGPAGDIWIRRGVMQFEHAHGFRPQVPHFLQAEWPEAHRNWMNLGAQPLETPRSDGSCRVMGVLSRRLTFERALRRAAQKVPGLTLRRGHVDGLILDGKRVVGARVDGAIVEADLVVDASGRVGRHGMSGMQRSESTIQGDCGIAYVNRTYRLRPGAAPGPVVSPLAYTGDFDGYQCLVFLHEAGHFSVVFVRPTADAALKALQFQEAFDAACRAIPALAEWTQQDRALITSAVLVGGALRNTYRRQGGVPGLVAVGDSVATTTPTRGRGIAMACMQITALLALLDEGTDPVTVAEPFGAWCDHAIEPWVADHIAIDGGMVRRWKGEDLDLTIPLTSDLIAAAADADPRIGELTGGYFEMTALPETLRPAEPLARAVYQDGWRPAYAHGPNRDELVDVIRAAVPAA